MTIIAMIPARLGSVRLKKKNLALLNGRPLISYAINAAIEAKIFDRIIVNSDSEAFRELADRYNAGFYLRPGELGSSTAKSDFVVRDFMERFPCDYLAWINTTAPLQPGADIRNAVKYMLAQNLDSMITVKNEQVHSVFKDRPLNFRKNDVFAQTQDLIPVQHFVYSVMAWRCRTFLAAMKKRGSGLLCGKIGYYRISKRSSWIIKTEEDLVMAEGILRATREHSKRGLRYHRAVPAGKRVENR